MKHISIDITVIGGGAAGLSAAARCASAGKSVLLIDREQHLGGVLLQCIHNGFGLHYFKEELTGPEYAARMEKKARDAGVEFLLDASVMEIQPNSDGHHLTVYSGSSGVSMIQTRAVIMAMGCRERNRGNLGIPGDRVSGVFTAGLAQRLLNMDGCLPGTSAVIVGSGDIGLIMARRLTWCGIKVKTVVEILPHPSGLSRNIAQCLQDFDIPLQLSTSVTKIIGRDRVEAVKIAPLVNGKPDLSREETISCDTVLFSVGLVPETELAVQCGIQLNPGTRGAAVDSAFMTSVPGIFSCGNVLHVHDLVDFVSEESECCAGHVIDYLEGRMPEHQLSVQPDCRLSYVVPGAVVPGRTERFYMRPKILCRKAVLAVTAEDRIITRKTVQYVKPAEMLTLDLPGNKTAELSPGTALKFSLTDIQEEQP